MPSIGMSGLKGTPNDFGSELLAKEFEGRLHPMLSDIAPGADEVRVDFDFHLYS
jgi:hypothetical protein